MADTTSYPINRPYQQCSRCVMDTSDTEITFNDKGQCDHCTNYLIEKSEFSYQGPAHDQLLNELVSKMKRSGKNKKYDCIIGISGGADGCYAAYLCIKLGLRVLLVHMDNGWDSNLAVQNIKLISDKLGCDYISDVLDWEEFKDLQLSFLKASVPEIETPTDVAILGSLHRVANKYNVKYIVMGSNYATEGILPKSWHYNSKDKKYIKGIQKIFGTRSLKNFPFFDYGEEFYNKFIKGVKIIYPLNYVPYSSQIAKDTLANFNWEAYAQKHHESFYTAFVQSYILPKKFNIDYRRVILSIQICNGLISREDALQLLSQKNYDDAQLEKNTDYVCKKLGISLVEFNQIMSLPPKTYKDYPNNQKRLEFIYKIYKRIRNWGLFNVCFITTSLELDLEFLI